MQKSRGWMAGWRVTNAVDENGADARRIMVDLQVLTQSPVAMALCALTGKPSRLLLRIEAKPGERKSDVVETFLSVRIVPGWKTTKTGHVLFAVWCEYSGMVVRDLDRLTTAQPLTVGLDLVQEDFDLDPVATAMQSFVRGMGASGGGSVSFASPDGSSATVKIPDDPAARFLMGGEDGRDGNMDAAIGEARGDAADLGLVPLEDLTDDELDEIGLSHVELVAWRMVCGDVDVADLDAADKRAHGRARKKLISAGYASLQV